MAEFVYILCGLTSLTCTVLLFKRYSATALPLLFWSGVAFLCLTVTNILLFVDLVLVPGVDLMVMRNVITLFGVGVLLYGLIRENT